MKLKLLLHFNYFHTPQNLAINPTESPSIGLLLQIYLTWNRRWQLNHQTAKLFPYFHQNA